MGATGTVTVDLNADVGEVSDPADVDGALMDVVSSASVACGFHAGNRAVMTATIEAAARRGVVVGAHPSYRDRAGFGRRPVDVTPDQLRRDITEQLTAIADAARSCDTAVRYVKAHGALYNAMGTDAGLTTTVAGAVRAFDPALVLLVPAGSVAVGAASSCGVTVATEAFADRAYLPDGRLVPRRDVGAVLCDGTAVTSRAVALACEGRVRAVDGTWIELTPASICVHGDTPGAAGLAAGVRAGLVAAGVDIAPFAG